MQRRVAVLARFAIVPAGVAVAGLLFAGPARAGEPVGPPPGQAEVQLMPVIGSGTHPVELDSWGVGNG